MPTLLEAVMDAPTLPHKLWTREDCAVLEREGLIEAERYELIEGELILKMGKKSPHNHAVMRLIKWLRSFTEETFVAQEVSMDVRPEDNPTNEPEPDAIVLNRSFLEIPGLARPEHLRLVAELFRRRAGGTAITD